jgi:hypothetical protein
VTAKKHDASTRFWYLLERCKSLGIKTDDPDWTNPLDVILRPLLSCSVLPGNPLDDAIAIAFAKTGLNVRDPSHWKALLGLFCLAHFSEWPKPAAHKRWTAARLEQLDKDTAEIWARRPDFSDKAVARILKEKKSYEETYGQYSISYIRERIRDARKSKQEREELLKKHLTYMRRIYETLQVEWTSELEAEVTHSFKETARKVSGASVAD